MCQDSDRMGSKRVSFQLLPPSFSLPFRSSHQLLCKSSPSSGCSRTTEAEELPSVLAEELLRSVGGQPELPGQDFLLDSKTTSMVRGTWEEDE